jgi:hypothetical protein
VRLHNAGFRTTHLLIECLAGVLLVTLSSLALFQHLALELLAHFLESAS